ncbi:MAG: hypothetical protein P8K80_01325 [Phycisphaerales bacterium]|nr:hypothetical protein [Phycisphaerales bacterium]
MSKVRIIIALAAAPLLTSFAQAQEPLYEDAFLDSVFIESADGDRFVAGDSSWNNLVVHGRSPGGEWIAEQTIDISSEPDRWNWGVDLSGDRLAILFETYEVNQYTTEIDLMTLDQGTWTLEARIECASILGDGWNFQMYDLHGDELAISCLRAEDPLNVEFKLLTFRRAGSQWELGDQVDLVSSGPVLEEDWTLHDSYFSCRPSIESDRMVVVEHVMYERNDGLALKEFPIFHTLQRNSKGEWSLADSMPLPPIPGPGTDIHSTNWIEFDVKGGRLMTRETYRFSGFEYFESYAWSEYNWDVTSGSWMEADDSVLEELESEYPWPDIAWQVELLSEDHMMVLWENNGLGPCSEAKEYRRDGTGWRLEDTYFDSEPGSCLDMMKTTEDHLFIVVVRNEGPGTLFFDISDGDDNSADITGDGVVNVEDLLTIIQNWGTDDEVCDLDGNGVVDVNDLLYIIQNWGSSRGQAPGVDSLGTPEPVTLKKANGKPRPLNRLDR